MISVDCLRISKAPQNSRIFLKSLMSSVSFPNPGLFNQTILGKPYQGETVSLKRQEMNKQCRGEKRGRKNRSREQVVSKHKTK